MIKAIVSIFMLFIALFSIFAQGKESDSSNLSGLYLGQKIPGLIPEIFAPGLISTEANTDFSSSFSPDGTEFFFTRRKPKGVNQLYYSKMRNNMWSTLSKVSFVNHYHTSEASISPDGRYIFFGSRELKSSNGTVWYSERVDSVWGKPKQLLENMMYATLSSNHWLYYTDKSGGSMSSAFLVKAKFQNGALNEISEITIANENKYGRAHPFIAPDESYLIFDQMGELFITFKMDNGEWSSSIKLNNEINTSEFEFAPHVTPDGKYLFFTREDNIFWVNTKVIDVFKSK
jgi:Tol biopolymer transport system component